jgi:hypothetical protein
MADPTVRAALDQAFNDSQAGTTSNHEEGGWIFANAYNANFHIVRVPSGPIGGNLNMGNIPTMPSERLVGEFHTHPYRQGQPAMPGYVFGNPARPSPADTNGANNQSRVPGQIRYRDRRGRRRTSTYGPNRGQCTPV